MPPNYREMLLQLRAEVMQWPESERCASILLPQATRDAIERGFDPRTSMGRAEAKPSAPRAWYERLDEDVFE